MRPLPQDVGAFDAARVAQAEVVGDAQNGRSAALFGSSVASSREIGPARVGGLRVDASRADALRR